MILYSWDLLDIKYLIWHKVLECGYAANMGSSVFNITKD